ncbi:hypothetical protein LCGC14_2485690 [marine sediment metagenome]|uniref:Uncharacterized protein n=1 Tax=marine sediment metagenome TaxID=412755 RepID=A0A0F9B676_9ZZZZ
MQRRTNTVFRDIVCGVVAVKRGLCVVHFVFRFPVVGREKIFGVGDVSLGPFQFVQFAQIFNEILVGPKRLGNLAEIDYSGSSEFVPNLADNGVG